ncbi:MAG: L-seryl-tRNA(Sec) selenium transferase [Pyrinomonadaceae bacterium]
MAKSKTSLNEVLRGLPAVSELLATPTARAIALAAGESHAAELSRQVVDQLRQAILEGGAPVDNLADEAESRLSSSWRSAEMRGIRRVINATGVVIHTNLGRSRLADTALEAITQAAGYCTLEYDTETGKRGSRGRRAEELLIELTGAEDVLVVNNCAAAAFFVLTAFASGGEVVISRGELVEIGGDFRVPDVLTQSGARLSEVGTTNRTKLADYEKAVGENTRMLLRVHPSNYRIVGFTTMPTAAELAALARQRDLVFYEDIGSGALRDLSPIGIAGEPVVAESIKAGVDIVTFSGDKLLGGPQAGIIAGKRDLIDKLRRHPLYRALRVDKITYAALEATLEIHRRGEALNEIPTLKMLSMNKEQIGERVAQFVEKLANKLGEKSDLKFGVIDGDSATGGGAAPDAKLETKLIAFTHKTLSAVRIEHKLRFATVPVIARIVDDRVLLDLRTVSEVEESELLENIVRLK